MLDDAYSYNYIHSAVSGRMRAVLIIMTAWRREARKEEALDERTRERAIVNPTNVGTVSKAQLGKLLRDGVERMWAFPSA